MRRCVVAAAKQHDVIHAHLNFYALDAGVGGVFAVRRFADYGDRLALRQVAGDLLVAVAEGRAAIPARELLVAEAGRNGQGEARDGRAVGQELDLCVSS